MCIRDRPGTTFFLGKNKYANGRKMIDNGCNVSLASDFNPGTCTIRSLSNIMHLAMQRCGLSLDEAFLGVTYNASRALGLDKKLGLIKKGYNPSLLKEKKHFYLSLPFFLVLMIYLASIYTLNNNKRKQKLIKMIY